MIIPGRAGPKLLRTGELIKSKPTESTGISIKIE